MKYPNHNEWVAYALRLFRRIKEHLVELNLSLRLWPDPFSDGDIERFDCRRAVCLNGFPQYSINPKRG